MSEQNMDILFYKQKSTQKIIFAEKLDHIETS